MCLTVFSPQIKPTAIGTSNTTPIISKVLYGLNVQPDGLEDAESLAGDYDIAGSMYEHFTQEINDIRRQDVFWIEYD